MAPATGRPSSSVAHGSTHTPPNAAATYSTMTALKTPAERCPEVTVKQLQTLPVANEDTVSGPSNGWTSRRSACGFTAAGTVSSARMFSCARVKAPFLQTNAPSKEFTAQRQKKPQSFLMPHGFVVYVLMRKGSCRSLRRRCTPAMHPAP
ncbi:regulator of sigma E protease [Trypanosoma cruzi]|nr:regulator of sigma E protease [Trypanosoma cruzi]